MDKNGNFPILAFGESPRRSLKRKKTALHEVSFSLDWRSRCYFGEIIDIGEECQLFKLKSKGTFQIWTKETLQKYGFTPKHSPYYIVLHFDPKKMTPLNKQVHLKEGLNTYRAKIRRLSDFIGINQRSFSRLVSIILARLIRI